MRSVFQHSAILYAKKRKRKINQAHNLNLKIQFNDSTHCESQVHHKNKKPRKLEANQILPEDGKGSEILPSKNKRQVHRKKQFVVQ